MKAEDSTPTPTPSAPQTPVQQTYTSQWASTPLQQTGQHPTASYYQPYTSHYPQAAYAPHYQAYAPPQPATTQQQQQAQQQQQQQAATRPVTAAPYQTSTYSLSTAAATSSGTSTTAAASNAANNNNNNSGGMDTADVATLNDALGSAGVDLRAEEESLQRSSDPSSSSHPLSSSHAHPSTYRAYEDRTRKQPLKPSFPTHILSPTVRTIASQHKITRIPDDSVNYLALALRARMQDLVVAMVGAARHRVDTQFDRPASFYGDEEGGSASVAATTNTVKTEGEVGEESKDAKPDGRTPMWSIVVRKDVSKQLAALEKVEREEELKARKERKDRAELTAAHAAALAAQASGLAGGTSGTSAYGAGLGGLGGGGAGGGGDGDGEGGEGGGGGGPTKKKRKKDGPGVTARNMSEDVRKKMSNAVATQAAGLGGKYSWMTAANASGGGGAGAAAAKPKPAITTSATATTTAATADSPSATTPGGTSTPAPGTTGTGTTAGSTWARPYISTKKPGFSSSLSSGNGTSGNGTGGEDENSGKTLVTMRDAMFVIEKERGHGGGRGAARGWV